VSTPYLPTAGVPDDPQFNGVYIAQVALTADPLNAGRVKLYVPQVLGTAMSNWAQPMQPGITPAAGTNCQAVFLGGNINLPYYFLGVSETLIEAISGDSSVLNSNPFFTGNLITGWAAANGTLTALTPNPDTNPPFTNAALWTASGTGGGYIQESAATFNAVLGNLYQIQAWVYYPIGGTVNIGASFTGVGATVISTSVAAGTWTFINAVVTATAATGYPLVGPANSSTNDQFQATAITVIGQVSAGQINGIINGTNAFGSSNAGSTFLLYNGAPGAGNLIGSWSPSAGGVDSYGNAYPIGFNAVQGSLVGMGISNAQIMETTLQNCSSITETISDPTITGGVMIETAITFDSSGGTLLAYTSTTTTISQNTNGIYTWACPSAVSTATIQCWGAGGGGSGAGTLSGQNTGGPSGGGGEFAAEYSYAVTPGQFYEYLVGNGGSGGAGVAGLGGGDTHFDTSNAGVYANGGDGNEGAWTGGLGGTGSTNSVHQNGGNGVAPTSGDTGGCSGGNSGNGLAAGHNGIAATSSSGASSPITQAGSGGGGAGGNAGANGGGSGSPGGGGGGAGWKTGITSFSQSWEATGSRSYAGFDASGSPNSLRNTNGTIWQGYAKDSWGSQKSIITFPTTTLIAPALVGATVSSCTLSITNNHSWYSTGLSVGFEEWLTSGGAPPTWNGTGAPGISTSSMNEGVRKTFSLGSSIGNDFKNSVAYGVALVAAVNLSTNWYGYFNGTPNNSNGPVLNIQWTTGGTPTTGSAGQDGQVYITYTTGSTIVCAISPLGGTDQYGNAIAAGYTGAVTAFTPSSSPSLVETWHHLNGASGWGASGNGVSGFWYRMNPDGFAEALFDMTATSVSPGSGQPMIAAGGIPSAYCPSATGVNAGPCCIYGTIPTNSVIPYLEVLATGAVWYRNGSASSGTFSLAGYIRWWPGAP
jgi:hypothetical protein